MIACELVCTFLFWYWETILQEPTHFYFSLCVSLSFFLSLALSFSLIGLNTQWFTQIRVLLHCWNTFQSNLFISTILLQHFLLLRLFVLCGKCRSHTCFILLIVGGFILDCGTTHTFIPSDFQKSLVLIL